MILIGLLAALLVLLGACGVFLRRNNSVCAFLLDLNDEIHRLDSEDSDGVYQHNLKLISAGKYAEEALPHLPSWRRVELELVSYNEMFWQPWRPLQSFYREGFPETPAPAS
jgi:hypothetical protein